MNTLENKKQVSLLTWLFAAAYMISYITRINYGAVILEMSRATAIPKTMLSLALTGSFITYGAGQIISGICGDKFSPKKLIFYGLGVTTVMNLLIPLCPNVYCMVAVWCVNGLAQAFMWPPMVRLMASLFSPEDYKRAVLRVNWGSSFGTIAVYLVAPILIAVSGWRAMFIFSALCGIVMMTIWLKFCPEVQVSKEFAKKTEEEAIVGKFFSPVLLGIMVSVALVGILRDGVTTWMPTYISETYHLSSEISILTGVILPIFSILSFKVSEMLYRKKLTNPLFCSAVIFGTGALSSLVLFFLSGQNAGISIFFSALLTGAMHGVNLILISMIPPFFRKTGNVSTVSGVLNSCVYVGSAASTYGVALLAERYSWSFTLFVWFLIAVAGTVLCLFCTRPWQKKVEQDLM